MVINRWKVIGIVAIIAAITAVVGVLYTHGAERGPTHGAERGPSESESKFPENAIRCTISFKLLSTQSGSGPDDFYLCSDFPHLKPSPEQLENAKPVENIETEELGSDNLWIEFSENNVRIKVFDSHNKLMMSPNYIVYEYYPPKAANLAFPRLLVKRFPLQIGGYVQVEAAIEVPENMISEVTWTYPTSNISLICFRYSPVDNIRVEITQRLEKLNGEKPDVLESWKWKGELNVRPRFTPVYLFLE